MSNNPDPLFQKISNCISSLNLNSINKERKNILKPLIDYVQQKVTGNAPVHLNFICTHNSRRSHLSQVWAQTMAAYFSIPNVNCYSGGTEATALFQLVGETLEQQGFEVTKLSEEKNPVYSIKFAGNAHPVMGFSKTYDHPFNPVSKFAAILTCSQADAGCPYIAGAEKRIPVTYEDPKSFDGTSQQREMYLQRSIQIATELKYVFSKINFK